MRISSRYRYRSLGEARGEGGEGRNGGWRFGHGDEYGIISFNIILLILIVPSGYSSPFAFRLSHFAFRISFFFSFSCSCSFCHLPSSPFTHLQSHPHPILRKLQSSRVPQTSHWTPPALLGTPLVWFERKRHRHCCFCLRQCLKCLECLFMIDYSVLLCRSSFFAPSNHVKRLRVCQQFRFQYCEYCAYLQLHRTCFISHMR